VTPFNAKDFLEKLAAGRFDGHLTEVIKGLTHDQLLEVCRLLAERERVRAQVPQTT
jgi:hypothetical protein